MKIRIHETDFDGNPVDCTGEFFQGDNAFAIVEAMQLNPFTASLEPIDFMQQILAKIDVKEPSLSDDAETAAVQFLQKLTTMGFAKFEIDDGELDTENPIIQNNDNLDKK